MTKALFFDIDGTLVSFNTHTIPASTIEALTAAHQKGIQIFIATGRPPQIINNLGELQDRGLIDGYVTMNGAYCFVGDEIIYKSSIPHTDVLSMVRFCQENNYPCIFVGEKEASVCQPDQVLRSIFYDFLKVNEFPIATFEEATSYDIFQMTPFFSTEAEAIISPQVPSCEFGRWHPAFVDITAIGNNKRKGIDQMIEHMGLNLEEVMAFGDGGNDISMLEHVGIGVAMGNGRDEVKAAAKYVTDTVDDHGIANALKHFGIID